MLHLLLYMEIYLWVMTNKEKFSITSPYAQDKLTVEHYAKIAFEIFNTSSVGLRLFNVYGPGQKSNSPYSAVIPIFINRMLKKLTSDY